MSCQRWWRMRRLDLVVGVALFLVVAMPALGQGPPVGDPVEDYLRVLQISGEASLGSFLTRPLVLREDHPGLASDGHPWAGRIGPDAFKTKTGRQIRVDVFEARLRMFNNLRYPGLANDGVVWQGKGVTTALNAGTTLTWAGLRLTVRPTLMYTQNADFVLAPVRPSGVPEYGYPWRRIDLPQRFGPSGFWTLDPGESELRLSGKGVTLGVGTTNLWWGPGIRNAIIMSNNAGGFAHTFLGTRGPRDLGIGTIEANWIWGRLAQSEWFDPAVAERARFLTGFVAAFTPDVLDGLSVGLTRVFYGWVPDGGVPLSDLFMVLQGVRKVGLADASNPTGDDTADQILSVFFRWILPESGFEVYTEWARNDHAWDLRDLVLEPEHSQAYTLGLQKAVAFERGSRLALRAELTHLEREATFRVRTNPVYYTHHIVTPGYTQRGQVIGAGIGPGGIQQHLGADLYTDRGRFGVFLQRRVLDNDAYYDWVALTDTTFDRHDVSLDLAVNALAFVRSFDLGAGVTYTRQFNRHFADETVNNVNLSLSAHWRAGAR